MFTGPRIATDGLIVYLDGGNTKSFPRTGTTWFNKSGNNNVNSTLVNGPTFSNGGIVFDGTNDYVDTFNDLSWNNTNSASISMYVKPSSLASYSPFIGKGPDNWEWQLNQKTTLLEFVYWNTSGGHTNGPVFQISDFFINTTDFVNLCLVWNHVDNKYYIYRNSVLVNTTTWVDASINQNRTNSVNIGGNIYRWGTSSSYWSGTISNTKMYNRALSAEEVLQNYNATKSRFNL
jgi:hypothetical protein